MIHFFHKSHTMLQFHHLQNSSSQIQFQFDFGHHTSAVNGSPRYEASHGTQLLGYLDDNGDGIKDGSDGGVYGRLFSIRISPRRRIGTRIYPDATRIEK